MRRESSHIQKYSHFPHPAIYLLLVLALLLGAAPVTWAKDFPSKPITIVVPWAAGATTDLTARLVGQRLSKLWNVPVSVINKPGGSGAIGTLEVLKSAPDGYTVMADCNGTSSIQYAWSQDLPYKVEERSYMVRAILTPGVLAVKADAPWKTMNDMTETIKKNPTGFRWSSIGGSGFPDALLFQHMAALKAKGVDISKTRTVTYKGTGEVTVALAGGHIDQGYAAMASVFSLLGAKKIRVLAVAEDQRYKGWPDVLTTAEQGFPTVKLSYWMGIAGPVGIPKDVVQTWIDGVKAAVSDPEIVDKLDKVGVLPAYLPGDQFRNFVLEEGKSIKALKVK